MASTVLPNGIIVPEKFSRDWYADLYHNWQELDNLLGGGTPKDGTLTIQKNGDTVGTFSANQATDETINITVPDVNDATLTIQQNGTTVDTFTANSSSDKTVNIQCVDLTNNQTVGGNKEFTGTTTAHDVIPSATETYNFGSSSAQWNNAYIKSLTINGVACGDILTHNVSEFVDVSSNQTVNGIKTFTSPIGIAKGSGDVELSIKNTSLSLKTNTNSGMDDIRFTDKDNLIVGGLRQSFIDSKVIGMVYSRSYSNDGNSSTQTEFNLITDNQNGISDAYVKCNNFCPNQNATINLGTSANKWKSFNGINPGALSLPSMAWISLDTTGFDVTNTIIGTFTSTINGWAILSMSQKNKPFGIWILQGSYRVTYQSVYHQGDYLIFALIPVWPNLNLTIYCTADDIDSTRKVNWLLVFPCQGNV